jgi:hypothetical protein
MWSTRPFSMPFEFYIGHMVIKYLPLVAIALIGPLTAAAQERKQIPLPAAQGIGSAAGYDGYRAAYAQFFGDQPNKPAHTTLQVVLPAARRGALIEIDLIAVRPM